MNTPSMLMSRLVNRRTALIFGVFVALVVTSAFLSRSTLSRGRLSASPVGSGTASLAPANMPLPPNVTVTNNNDSGSGSLRDAIANVSADGTIDFDPMLSGQTITLTGGELVIDKNLTIQGLTSGALTISGNNASRIFNVIAGVNFTFSNLTISGGQATTGGGISNLGNMTILNSTLTGNTASGSGGAILTEGGVVRIINSTISGNTAGSGVGGGLYNGGTSQTTITNSTIASNNNEGIRDVSTNALLLNNTIVARNPNCGSCDEVDVFVENEVPTATIDPASSNNLIGVDTGVIGISNGTNGNQIGAAEAPVDPLLAPLANNGGPTLTHALNAFSPAADSGNNALALDQNNAALTTDQRGAGYPRIDHSVVDIGAYETTFVPPPPSADVGVSKSTASEESLTDRDIVYTITVTNAGPDAAASVTLNDLLPGDLTFVSMPTPAGWSCMTPSVGFGGTVNCTNPNLAVSSVATFTLTVHIPASTGETDYHNVATVSTSTSDPNSVNDSASANVTVVSCLTNPTVTSNADSGVGSLRQAIIESCDGSTITFNMSQVVSPITLTSGELVIDKNLTISGPGAAQLTVSGNNASRVFNINPGKTVTLSGLTIANGNVTSNGFPNDSGGGIVNDHGALTVSNCVLNNNKAQGPSGTGGAIYNNSASGGPASLTINNSTLSNNLAGAGGAIFNNGNTGGIATVTINDSTLSANGANSGGAIYNSGHGGSGFNGSATINLNGSTLNGNQSVTFGGGIFNICQTVGSDTGACNLNINNSTISGNGTGSGQGGGVYSQTEGGTATVIFSNSTLSSNTAALGGGIQSSNGTLTMTNSTVSGNSASGQGGGTFSNSTTINLTNVTVTNNRSNSNNVGTEQGGGMFPTSGTVTLTNTIVAGNFSGTGSTRDDISGAIDAASSFNLIGDGTNMTGITNGTNSNQVGSSVSPIDALLGLLANNGGPTQTHALLPGSPAINAGGNAAITNPPFTGSDFTDQRGTGFDRIVNTTVDIGAFESRGFTISTTSGTPQSAAFNTGFADPLVATVSSAFGEPVNGGQVKFTAPGSGASATFTGGVTTINATINASGQANASATANATVGGPYNVTAAGNGITGTADFSLTNIKANQTITFASIADKTFGDPDFIISPSASSGLPVSLGASGNCTVTSPSPGTVHITSTGSCTITASQAGDSNYNPATDVPRSFTISKANQTITFNALASKTFGDPDFVVSATASSGLPVSFAASGNCTVTTPSPGTVHITGAGSCTITASQAGDSNYNAATDVPRSFTINKANQTITFNALASKTFGDPDFVVSAAASSGLPVSFGASGNCTVTSPSPGTVHITGAGSCTITASQAGDANYNAATDVPRSFTINKATQTITFNALTNKTFGDPDFAVSATASSGLPVSFAASGNCTVTSPSPGTVHITGAGSCTITASQAGDANYNAATDVPRSFTISKANQTITFNALVNKTLGDPDFVVSATASSGLPVSFGASGNCTVTSPSPGTVHLTGAGSCTITASQAGDSNYNAAADVPRSFNIAKAATGTAVTSTVNPSDLNQSVTFTATVTSGAGTPTGTVQFKDNAANLGAAVALNASGVAQFTTSSLTAGTHTITAEYSGDANFLPSTGTLAGGQVVKAQPSLSINDVSITEGNAGTKLLNFTVTLSAASNLTVTANYTTANGTATAPSDYTSIASTLLTFNPGDTSKTIPVTINGDVSFEPDETFFVNLSNPGNATISDNQGRGTIQNDDALGGFISFSQANTDVNENAGIVTLTVTRGVISFGQVHTEEELPPVNVDYATDDTGAASNCAALNTGLASQRCDLTSVLGTLKFAANETQKTIDIPINLDAYNEGPEVFTVKLSNPTGGAVALPATATVTINDSTSPTPNAIDETINFVRQQYRDFLNREADAAGLAFWTDNIEKCNDPARRPANRTLAQCIEVQRILTSAAFFLSIEFKQTGGTVRDFYVAALDRPLTNNMPGFVEFMRDTQAIQKGVVVGQGNWQQVLDANRTAFMNEFVTRAEFVGLYPTTDTPAQYVDKLYLHANVTASSPERLSVIGEFGGAATAADPGARARALFRITQNLVFQAREANRTFVQIEYFGYLRRDPDIAGYNFWVNKLNQFNGDFLQAEMVKAFLSSLEYRARFGP